MVEYLRLADQGKDKAVNGAPKVSGMANVVGVTLGHIPAVQ